jgi:DNA-directed RNA polymerase subunit RPC12/RpoP
MARLLSCPQCRAEFAFDEWARGASCPACGRRLSFLELGRVDRQTAAAAAPDPVAAPASAVGPDTAVGPGAAAAPDAAPAATPAMPAMPPASRAARPADTVVFDPPAPAEVAPATVVPLAPAQDAPVFTAAGAAPGATWSAPLGRSAAERRRYSVGGKPLRWTAGWTVVAVIWAIAAVAMVVVRVSMGPITVMTPAETAAIDAVRQVRLPTGATTETVLRYAATHDLTLEGHVATIPPGGTQMWYAFDRPWEHRIYVSTTLPGTSMMGTNVVLSWTVSGGTATAAAATRAALAKTAQTMAHPPSPTSVPAVPGIIPSIPPDLQ